ncbi:hypothetical protein CB1_000590010 [Camelus ferus]|nr:hypothetical protein CB1_000590010 [Camelus ferus]
MMLVCVKASSSGLMVQMSPERHFLRVPDPLVSVSAVLMDSKYKPATASDLNCCTSRCLRRMTALKDLKKFLAIYLKYESPVIGTWLSSRLLCSPTASPALGQTQSLKKLEELSNWLLLSQPVRSNRQVVTSTSVCVFRSRQGQSNPTAALTRRVSVLCPHAGPTV